MAEVKTIVADFLSGKPDTSSPTSGNSNYDESQVVTGQESTSDDLLPGSESGDAPADPAQDSQTEPASSATGKPDQVTAKEVITVTDETGKRRKVEIDYTDRKAIRKAHEMMHGARKWQAERDQALKNVEKERSERTSLKSNWDALEGAFQKSGIEGVIDLLEGKNGAWKTWEQRAIQKAKFLENASPEEIQALESREKADRTGRELERIRKENEQFRREMTETKEQADLRSLESRVNPVFDKYRFADKLGDTSDEQMFDEMLWNSALKRLEPYEAQGLDITPELVDREFRTVASSLRKRIGTQAEKKATRVLDQKKQEATENVQAKVQSGYKTGGAAKEARDLIDNRNLTGLLKNWGKYGGLFNGSKK